MPRWGPIEQGGSSHESVVIGPGCRKSRRRNTLRLRLWQSKGVALQKADKSREYVSCLPLSCRYLDAILLDSLTHVLEVNKRTIVGSVNSSLYFTRLLSW